MATGNYRDLRIIRFIVGRRRLLLSFAAGVVLLALLPGHMHLATRFILAWDLTATLYIVASVWMITHSTVDDCQDHAALYDEGDWIILALVIASAAASFICIAVELPLLKSHEQRCCWASSSQG